MTLRIADRVVVFDYGEVISLEPSAADRDALVAIAGVDGAAFWPSYWRHRDGLDRGTVSVPQYWRLIAADVGAEWSASTVQRLWARDFTSWISVEPGTIDLIAELHAGGTRVALLSNAGFDFAGPFRFSPMAEFFERMFVSAEMDNIKPDPAIYLEVADGLGITPAQMVFIDNKKINTDAAAELGATVHHYVHVAGLRQFLTALAN
ncbi:HAD family phosphatase [Conyzicola nivalis]|uniref:Haloacid dehalogenase n=1 Tax=Conyzicola nivalis TaxID=1477021 RepID=A0A916WEY3_9MICO|nr:HAD-IA family hydrolase [Conyzicola nivalis]GGA91433.1 haloacid dehalogenase [Conyzicola nivalis]